MLRSRLLKAGLLLTVSILMLGGPLGGAASAHPKGRCDAGLLDAACEAARGVANSAKSAVGNAVTAPVEAAAGGVMESLTRWVASAAVSLIGKVVSLLQETTDPRLGTSWFVDRYELMMGFGLLIILPLLLIATIRAVVRQDLGQLVRSFFVYLPIAILATFVAIHLVQALLAATDQMSEAVSRNIGGDATKFLDGGSQSVSGVLDNPVIGGFLMFFGSLLVIVAGFLLWIELLIRSAGIYVCVFFLPFVLAGLVWPSTARWTPRLIETLVALILSKFLIVSIISLAVAAMGDPGEGGVSTVIGGAALLSLAAFSPFALFKLIPMAEMAGIGHLEGMERRPARAARSGGWNLQSFVKEKVAHGKSSGGSSGAMRTAGTGVRTAGTAAKTGAAVSIAATAGAAKAVAGPSQGRVERQTGGARVSQWGDGKAAGNSPREKSQVAAKRAPGAPKSGGETKAPKDKPHRST